VRLGQEAMAVPYRAPGRHQTWHPGHLQLAADVWPPCKTVPSAHVAITPVSLSRTIAMPLTLACQSHAGGANVAHPKPGADLAPRLAATAVDAVVAVQRLVKTQPHVPEVAVVARRHCLPHFLFCRGAPAKPASEQPAVQNAPSAPCLQESRPVPLGKVIEHVPEERSDFPDALDIFPQFNGSWEWIRRENGPEHRRARQQAGLKALRVLEKAAGVASHRHRKPSQLRQIGAMLQGTTRCSASSIVGTLRPNQQATCQLEHSPGNSIDVATGLAAQGLKVAAVNAASAYHVGGGFLSGGRHALEEAWCTQSTLFLSLRQAASGVGHACPYIPVDGCLITPHVEVFRGGSSCGYPALDRIVELAAVFSMAMFNRNPKVRDSPVDAPVDFQAYVEAVRLKFRALFHSAASTGLDVLVLPDIGCGIFKNDPNVVGDVVGTVLREYASHMPRVICTGTPAFYEAANRAFEHRSVAL